VEVAVNQRFVAQVFHRLYRGAASLRTVQKIPARSMSHTACQLKFADRAGENLR